MEVERIISGAKQDIQLALELLEIGSIISAANIIKRLAVKLDDEGFEESLTVMLAKGKHENNRE